MTLPDIDPDEIDPTGELSARMRAQQIEYGTYVANAPITVGSVYAYQPGHPVPISNVVKHGYAAKGLVDLVDGAEHDPQVAAQLRALAKLDPVPAQDDSGPAVNPAQDGDHHTDAAGVDESNTDGEGA